VGCVACACKFFGRLLHAASCFPADDSSCGQNDRLSLRGCNWGLTAGKIPPGSIPRSPLSFPELEWGVQEWNHPIVENGSMEWQEERSPTEKRLRILLAEDDHDLRLHYHLTLIHAGYQAETAEDGAAAWDMLQVSRYDLLITDNEMPRVSGVQLLERLRSARIAMPVIMAARLFPAFPFGRGPWLRYSATISKPFTGEALLLLVSRVLAAAAGRPKQEHFSRR